MSVDTQKFIVPITLKGDIVPINLGRTVVSLKKTKHVGKSTQVTLSADVLFAFNSAKLSGSAKQAIAGISSKIKGHPRIKVDGYTDSVGSAKYNQGLSQRRAQAVAAALRGKGQISAVGHGEADPVAPNKHGKKDNPDGRAKNRRVTIT
ncbi:MAG: OmpA family protein, partial [Solirubrobacterales bacterium]|nr:OmpA family protein [Solirubrobacterales bacterium]